MARLRTIDRNLMRDLANSPAVLGAYVDFYTALASGFLDQKLHDQIAIVVAEANGCEYCLSAHIALGRKAGLSEQQLAAARLLNTGMDRTDAALKSLARL
jgi:AhpD family alkylhydroperoxidase